MSGQNLGDDLVPQRHIHARRFRPLLGFGGGNLFSCPYFNLPVLPHELGRVKTLSAHHR
jgi:hypothetical protein